MIQSYRDAGKPVLLVSGPDEFLADAPLEIPGGIPGGTPGGPAASPGGNDGGPLPPPNAGIVAFMAHKLLRVDMGWLSPRAAAWIKGAQRQGLPPGYKEVGDAPVSLSLPTTAGKVGFVLFPRGKGPGGAPTQDQREGVLAAARALRPSVAFLIGVSPWGYEAERDFLPRAQGIFACLLGGGDGPGFAQSLQSKSPGVLWARSDAKGRCITEITLLQVPREGFQWQDGVSFTARLIPLTSDIMPDPAMSTLLTSPMHSAPPATSFR